ncbi:MAG: hypothetical protein MJ176_07075 [Treponema sp.]|nr:hypothetical protein [Treponema sp.]
MKKLISIIAVAFCAFTLSAQVMGYKGVINTLWSGFGRPRAEVNQEKQSIRWYGLHETAQARVDLGKFTMDGMLNWAAATNYNGTNDLQGIMLSNVGRTPLYYIADDFTDENYLNFVIHFTDFLDFGMGTRLEWKAGPAPVSYGYWWEPYAHAPQGGLLEGVPGSRDVAGYVTYANNYARTAIGAKLHYKKIFEVGFVIGDGEFTAKDRFKANLGITFNPIDNLSLGFAYLSMFNGQGEIYTGTTIGINKNFNISAYITFKNVGDSADNGVCGTGATLNIGIPKAGITLRPELGLTFYENDNYSVAWYTGCRFDLAIDQVKLGVYGSYGAGSSDRRWYDDKQPLYNETKTYTGGHVFNIRPDITITINKQNSLSAAFDYQYRQAFYGREQNVWVTGVYWTYRY